MSLNEKIRGRMITKYCITNKKKNPERRREKRNWKSHIIISSYVSDDSNKSDHFLLNLFISLIEVIFIPEKKPGELMRTIFVQTFNFSHLFIVSTLLASTAIFPMKTKNCANLKTIQSIWCDDTGTMEEMGVQRRN